MVDSDAHDAQVAPRDPSEVALIRIREAERTNADDLDLSNLSLGPILTSDWPGWEALEGVKSLVELKLTGNGITAIPARGWTALGCIKLNRLKLDENQLSEIPPEGWEAIERMHPRILDLSANRLTGIPTHGWRALGRMASLKHLYLSLNPLLQLSTDDWGMLSQLGNLKSLMLRGANLTLSDDEGKALRDLKALETLSLDLDPSTNISEKTWEALGGLGALSWLMLKCEMSVAGWRALGCLVNLKLLWVDDDRNGDTVVPWGSLCGLKKLEDLTIAGNLKDISADGWKTIGHFRRLRELRLASDSIAHVPTDAWRTLGRLGQLEKLNLNNNKITEIPLEVWSEDGLFPKLQALTLNGNPLPDDILAAASRGPQSLFEYLKAAAKKPRIPGR